MMSTAATFANIVMTLHVYCNSLLHPGQEISMIPWIYSVWLVVHMTGILIVIHHCSLLTKEVKTRIRCPTNAVT